MSFHEQLRQQYRQFKCSQQTLSDILQKELKSLEHYLRQALGLDKCYKANVLDEQPTEPYLRVSNPVVLDNNGELPKIRFDLVVVVDEGEEIYPKEQIAQLFELSYVHAERLVLSFLPPTKASFVFSLGDNEANKFGHFAKAYQQFLLHKLSRDLK